jgi:hypothetical protein
MFEKESVIWVFLKTFFFIFICLIIAAGFMICLFVITGLVVSSMWVAERLSIPSYITIITSFLTLLLFQIYLLNSKYYERERRAKQLFPADALTKKHLEFIKWDLNLKWEWNDHPYFSCEEMNILLITDPRNINLDTLNELYLKSMHCKPRVRINWMR